MTKKISSISLTVLLIVVAFATVASAAHNVVVTPTNTEGWSTSDTRPGGAVNYVVDATSLYPGGALRLTTDGTNAAKAQYLHSATSTSLSSVTELSYFTKQVSGPATAAASYQVAVDLNGAAPGGFTNLVYEPYWNGTVVPSAWQSWDVDAGQFWSSGSFSDGTCSVVSGAGGPPFYTLANMQANCPNAIVLGFGVNVGTYNPNHDVYVDGVNFNGTTYDFEVEVPDTTAPDAPMPISPLNNSTTTTAGLVKVDWSDVTDPSSPVTYIYQSSNSSAVDGNGAFVSPVYTSGPLTASEIPTPGTPEGTYYWHVTATDGMGNVSPWSTTWSFTVSNTQQPPTPPAGPTNKDQCKNGGWMSFTNPSFKNQGQCVSSVEKNK